ncbi:hypothetical protein ALC53_05046 [Atta colombica]|uniref:Uncharacterized protein n=1 Tax=Atta colombica TaxID=520822 RepID=A0A151I4J2_9HYME|nr:hypothetical protein ALC53_05046 [Atta colombica]
MRVPLRVAPPADNLGLEGDAHPTPWRSTHPWASVSRFGRMPSREHRVITSAIIFGPNFRILPSGSMAITKDGG